MLHGCRSMPINTPLTRVLRGPASAYHAPFFFRWDLSVKVSSGAWLTTVTSSPYKAFIMSMLSQWPSTTLIAIKNGRVNSPYCFALALTARLIPIDVFSHSSSVGIRRPIGRTPGLPRNSGDLGLGLNTSFHPSRCHVSEGISAYRSPSYSFPMTSGSKVPSQRVKSFLSSFVEGLPTGAPSMSIARKKFGESIVLIAS